MANSSAAARLADTIKSGGSIAESRCLTAAKRTALEGETIDRSALDTLGVKKWLFVRC
jgi:hypothetical protein